MDEHRTWRITKPKRLTILILFGLLVASVGVHVYFRFHLTGVYSDLDMACDCDWVFQDGQIYTESETGRVHVATYTRSGGRWICQGLSGETSTGSYYESSLLGVTWVDPQFKAGRRFLPRRCLSPVAEVLYNLHIRI